MIQIKDIESLSALMEHRYSPLLIQVLKTAALHGPIMISNPNPEKTCLPVQEVHLSAAVFKDGQRQRMVHKVNTIWQYDCHRDYEVVVYESDYHGERIRIRVCDETRRMV